MATSCGASCSCQVPTARRRSGNAPPGSPSARASAPLTADLSASMTGIVSSPVISSNSVTASPAASICPLLEVDGDRGLQQVQAVGLRGHLGQRPTDAGRRGVDVTFGESEEGESRLRRAAMFRRTAVGVFGGIPLAT